MKHQFKTMLFAMLVIATVFTSCKKDPEGVEENEEEVITTMELTFVPVGGGSTLKYSFDDPDGPGGAAPTQQDIILAPSNSYAVTVRLLNKTETPAGDITLEVAEENVAHRFYYVPSANNGITVSGLNTDDNAVPLGITSNWSTGSTTATGTMRIALRHYPGTPPGKALSDPIDSPKSGSDIDVTFTTKIQ